MDYVEWANQYYKDALKIKSVVSKYKEQLKTAKTVTEMHHLESKIISYKLIYRDLRNTGDLLMQRANNISVKTNITIS